jgi:hypothetical protein
MFSRFAMASRHRPLAPMVCVIILLLQLSVVRIACPATTIISDGGNLAAAVHNAANNDIIEIRSDETFIGTLGWGGKFLTIQSGVGFHPTVKGSPGPDFSRPAIGNVAGPLGTGGEIRGLRLEPGAMVSGVPLLAYSVAISDTGTTWSKMIFRNNDFAGTVSLGGTGDFKIDSIFEQNRFSAPFSIRGTGNLQVNAVGERNEFFGAMFTDVTGRAQIDLNLDSNILHGGVRAGGTGDARIVLDLRNNFLLPAAGAAPASTGVLLDGTGAIQVGINAVNNVIAGTQGTGIRLTGISRSAFSGAFVNNTVVGFDRGLRVETNSTASFENMLLYNKDDISAFLAASIRNSLISDGTFAGTNGNIAGIPLLGSQYEFLAGSLGIDAGNNAAAGLPSFDILGQPRIVDGNGDGIEQVDVGAFEFVPEPSTFALLAIGGIGICAYRKRRLN